MFFVVSANVHAEVPKRIASLNLCTDQYLLAFADPAQISSLSPWARDPRMAYYQREAKQFPQNNGSAETLIYGQVDLVMDGSYASILKQEMFRKKGIRTFALSPLEDLRQTEQEIRDVAALLGYTKRGDKLIHTINESLDRTRGIIKKPYKILVIFRRGYVPAENSTINILLKHFGFELYQQHFGLTDGGFLRLEPLVLDPPDYAIVDETTGTAMDHGSALLSHPALLRAIPPERRIVFPEKLFMCGGPTLPEAIRTLASSVLLAISEHASGKPYP